MTVRVVFFASIREDLGTDTVELEVNAPVRVADVIAELVEAHSPDWLEVLTAENIRIAVNQTMVVGDCELADGDELAFFPPVTGG